MLTTYKGALQRLYDIEQVKSCCQIYTHLSTWMYILGK